MKNLTINSNEGTNSTIINNQGLNKAMRSTQTKKESDYSLLFAIGAVMICILIGIVW